MARSPRATMTPSLCFRTSSQCSSPASFSILDMILMEAPPLVSRTLRMSLGLRGCGWGGGEGRVDAHARGGRSFGERQGTGCRSHLTSFPVCTKLAATKSILWRTAKLTSCGEEERVTQFGIQR